VRGVADDGPADRAGLAVGDLITGVGDVEVASPSDLEAALAALSPGATVTVHVVRGADELDVEVTFPPADGPTDAPTDAPTDDTGPDPDPGG
ncbi:MAG TPA: PDZ domain-containing protein, partial [Acidimicrobiales bacterium]|nr:PDZ domain-containing protein [Acidimicrobiales bacterium]